MLDENLIISSELTAEAKRKILQQEALWNELKRPEEEAARDTEFKHVWASLDAAQRMQAPTAELWMKEAVKLLKYRPATKNGYLVKED